MSKVRRPLIVAPGCNEHTAQQLGLFRDLSLLLHHACGMMKGGSAWQSILNPPATPHLSGIDTKTLLLLADFASLHMLSEKDLLEGTDSFCSIVQEQVTRS